MARTKQTARPNPPGPLNATPRLATAPHHDLLLGQNTEQSPEQTPEVIGQGAKETSESLMSEIPYLKPRPKESLFYVVRLGHTIEGVPLSVEEEHKYIRVMLSKRKMDYVDWYSQYERASVEENRFIHNCLDEIEHCEYELLDVFGDGNCLFYCLILMCKVYKRKVYTSGNMATRTAVLKMREALIGYYNQIFSENDENKQMVFTYPEQHYRERLKTRHRYSDMELDMLMESRMYEHDIHDEVLKVFKPHPNKSHNRYGFGTPEEHFKRIDNEKKTALEVADGHFVAKLFTRLYRIPIVYVQIDITGFNEKKEDYDLSSKNKNIQAWFNFYFYTVDRPDPKRRSYQEFPISILKKHCYFIICQKLFYVDPDSNNKVKYLLNNNDSHIMHHKFLVTRYKPPKESTEIKTRDLTESDDDQSIDSVASVMSEVIIQENGISMLPGLVIEYYEPGMMQTSQFFVRTIVLETNPENSVHPVRVSASFAIPRLDTRVRVIGKIILYEDVKEGFDFAKDVWKPYSEPSSWYELQAYTINKHWLIPEEETKCN